MLGSTIALSGCVSAVDDTTAFGFAEGESNSKIAESLDPQSDPDAMPTAADTSDGQASAVGDKPKETTGSATVETASSDGDKVSPAADATSLAERSTAMKPSVAAYAGATVTQGSASEDKPGAGGQSLFDSLFARSSARPPIANTDSRKSRRVVLKRDGAPESAGGSDLPGVDPKSLFEIGQRASVDGDLLDDMENSYQVASLSGLARSAPNGLMVQRDDVETSCFPQQLVSMVRTIERRFGKRVVITSGYRSPSHNRRVNGALRSQHMGCKAADLVVPDTDHMEVAQFVRSLPGRGGVGTYCHTKAIHVDVGPKRDWNWGCRRRN